MDVSDGGLTGRSVSLCSSQIFARRPSACDLAQRCGKRTIATSLTASPAVQDRGFGLPYAIREHGHSVLLDFQQLHGLWAVLWLPQIIHAMGFSNRATGFVAAVPYIAGMAGIYSGAFERCEGRPRLAYCARQPARRSELGWRVPYAKLYARTHGANVGSDGALLLVSAHTTACRRHSCAHPAAGGIALIKTSILSIGGFVGPVYYWHSSKKQTGSYTASMALLAFGELLGALIILAFGRALVPRPNTGPASDLIRDHLLGGFLLDADQRNFCARVHSLAPLNSLRTRLPQ